MTSGSSYETYEKTHTDYDKTRLAVGSEQIIRALKTQYPHNFSQLRILDAGCGTGALLHTLQEEGFNNLTGVDASLTGLAVAAQKLTQGSGGVKLICADIRNMPFEPASFDVIVFSFVVQHLPHSTEDELKEATKNLFAHVSKLLAPGGQIVIVTCSKEQLSTSGCMWYYKYFPIPAAKLSERFLPLDLLGQLLVAELDQSESGLATWRLETLERTYWTDASLDPCGPLEKSWRNGDSLFALCESEPELFQTNLQELRAEIESGSVNVHIAATRARAEEIKQGILLFAQARPVV